MTASATHASVLHDGEPYRGTDEIHDLVRAFEDTSLPYRCWTHAAHLTVGLWYVVWYGPVPAMDHMRIGLRRYNAAHADEPMRVGYHETITRFWLWVISEYVRRTPFVGSLADVTNGLIASHTDRGLPFRYYSREHLMSDTARHEWVEPDLGPLAP